MRKRRTNNYKKVFEIFNSICFFLTQSEIMRQEGKQNKNNK